MSKFRFSIRTLLVLATLVAFGSWYHKRRQRIHIAIDYIETLGGKVEYRSSFLNSFHQRTNHYFATPITVRLASCSVGPGDLQALSPLTELERLYLEKTQIRSSDIEDILHCKKLRRLAIWGIRGIGGEALDQLAKLPNLQVLDIHRTSVDSSEIKKLASCPKLHTLIFTPNQSTTQFGLTGADINALRGIPNLQPVSVCYLSDIDRDTLLKFISNDLSRVSMMMIRNCDLDRPTLERIDRINVWTLGLQFCSISADELRGLSLRPKRRLQIYLEEDPKSEQLTISQFSEILPNSVLSATAYENRLYFTIRGQRPLMLYFPAKTKDSLGIGKWIQHDCARIGLYRPLHVLDDLQECIASNFDGHLTVNHSNVLWTMVPKLTELNSLMVNKINREPIRFSPSMKLQHLSLTGQVRLRPEDIAQIAQLKRLQSIRVNNDQPLTLDDLAPILELENLKNAHFTKLTDAAKAELKRRGIVQQPRSLFRF
ncbi:hypothetical protein LOC67_23845 [Stieleria sp. JC731]|uniref:hypothetical protein n=1 Tax=Pirellulaceae TaxID=2691357 RepID=UPI001E3AE95F|nr:hypothetical protein [Stieleria sp. JC731]MCC9603594.1 hypothetical protein [Stieleria sp. JC731]